MAGGLLVLLGILVLLPLVSKFSAALVSWIVTSVFYLVKTSR